MDRVLTPAASAALTAGHVPLCVLAELQFPSGTLRFTNAGHDMDWDGETWIGAGSLAQIEPITETASPQGAAVGVRFSGIDPAYVTAILSDHYQGRTARIYVALCDDGMQVIDDPVLVFEGRMDEPTVTVGDTAEITLTLANRFEDWDRPRLRMYTDADQQNRHPGDRYCEFVTQAASTSITWGTYRGPVGPDPIKVLNRTIDKIVNYRVFGIPISPGTGRVLDVARNVGDRIAKVFGF